MKSISLSAPTYERLQRHAIPFDDTPEDVIVRLLDQADDGDAEAAVPARIPPRPSGSPARATPGSLAPLTEYWIPILALLDEYGGSAPSNDVVADLEERMDDVLTEKDREPIKSGAIRWRNRARFARLRMKERGLISDSSFRGIWEITDEGRAYLARHAAAN